MPRLSLLLALLLLLAASCGSAPAHEQPGGDPRAELALPAPRPRPRALASGWAQESPWSFERRVAALELGAWDEAALGELEVALARQDLLAVRAAVLLGHGGEESREVLLARLEQRALGPLRESDAGDVVAAAALERWPDELTTGRLTALAVWAPHPDLEVRTECAVVALRGGRDEVLPFLLRLLTAGTPAEVDDPIDWAPTDTLAWAKGRASAALARRAGVPDRFHADGSFEAQIAIARALRARLAGSL